MLVSCLARYVLTLTICAAIVAPLPAQSLWDLLGKKKPPPPPPRKRLPGGFPFRDDFGAGNTAPRERNRFVPIPFDVNPEDLVAQQLRLAEELGPLKDLVGQILRDPKKFNLDAQAAKGFDLNNPALKGLLQDWIARHEPRDKTLTPEQLKDLQAGLQKLLREQLMPPPDVPYEMPPEFNPPRTPPPPESQPPDDRLAKAAEKILRGAEESDLGDWLRDSPAWQRAVQDLQESLLRRPDTGNWNLSSWAEKLRPDRLDWPAGERMLDRLRELPRPNLDLGDWRPTVPKLGTPDLRSMPRGGRRALPALSWRGVMIGLALLLAVALAGWLALRLTRRRPIRRRLTAGLGPWPVRPEVIATRTELVRAFDYLALLLLGWEARSWHHWTVAAHWSKQDATHQTEAEALAALYERARYTDGPEALTDDEQIRARAALLAILGRASA